MSIMSDTYLVKSDGKFTVYVFGGFTFPDTFVREAKRKKKSVFQLFTDSLKPTKKNKLPWGEHCAIVDEAEAIAIADADHTVNDNKSGYHRFAGDAVYLIDNDEKRAYYRTRIIRPTRIEGESYLLPGSWKEFTTEQQS